MYQKERVKAHGQKNRKKRSKEPVKEPVKEMAEKSGRKNEQQRGEARRSGYDKCAFKPAISGNIKMLDQLLTDSSVNFRPKASVILQVRRSFWDNTRPLASASL